MTKTVKSFHFANIVKVSEFKLACFSKRFTDNNCYAKPIALKDTVLDIFIRPSTAGKIPANAHSMLVFRR